MSYSPFEFLVHSATRSDSKHQTRKAAFEHPGSADTTLLSRVQSKFWRWDTVLHLSVYDIQKEKYATPSCSTLWIPLPGSSPLSALLPALQNRRGFISCPGIQCCSHANPIWDGLIKQRGRVASPPLCMTRLNEELIFSSCQLFSELSIQLPINAAALWAILRLFVGLCVHRRAWGSLWSKDKQLMTSGEQQLWHLEQAIRNTNTHPKPTLSQCSAFYPLWKLRKPHTLCWNRCSTAPTWALCFHPRAKPISLGWHSSNTATCYPAGRCSS